MKNVDFEELISELSGLLPTHLLENNPRKSIQKILDIIISKLDLVSREEFDAQVKVLQRTREKLETLEKKLKEKNK